MKNKSTLSKITTVLAVAAILSFGLCTAGAFTYPDHAGTRQKIWEIGVWCMAATVALSIVGLLVIAALAVIRSLWRSPRSPR